MKTFDIILKATDTDAKLKGKHHPFCKFLLVNSTYIRSWTCCCNILKEYDKWRHTKQAGI